ncbi:MAG: flavin-containing monooxygenase [Oceanococcus sp.]
MRKIESSSEHDLLIIGAGFSGMCAAIQARAAGFSVKMLEKGQDVGGVWRENTYPGAACDVPWYLYSYSFFKEAIFLRPYPQQPEILRYQQDCARHYGLYECAEFGVEVAEAQWDEAQGLWCVTTTQGQVHSARTLVSGVGVLSRPAWPNIKGMDQFQGECFHSAQWDHAVNLKGRRVAVVGTGASAIQFIPEVAKEARHLTVFQRNAPYCLPRFDAVYGPIKTWLFQHVPALREICRYSLWKFGETLALTFNGDNLVSKVTAGVCGLIRRIKIRDPELRAKLTPDYAPGCKRILFTSNYYPSFKRPNVSLHVDGIARITPKGIVDKYGVEHEFDVLIMGTGFKATEFLAPLSIVGRGGANLHQTWQAAPSAYLGMTVPAFPNFFMMYGPNTNLGSNSIIYMIECQARYIVQALKASAEHGSLEVREDVFMRFGQELRERLSGMIWASGCDNWYQTAEGHNPTNWPGLTAEYRDRTAVFNLHDYTQVSQAKSDLKAA